MSIDGISKASLHPLAMLNISDYYTRSKNNQIQHIGVLLGQTASTKITVYTSFEILPENGIISSAFLDERIDQFKTVLPDFKFIGFYQILPDSNLKPNSFTISLIEQFQQILGVSEFVTLIFDPLKSSVESKYTDSEFPIKIFRVVTKPELTYSELIITVESSDAEKISVDTILNEKEKSNDIDLLKLKISSQKYSLRILHDKITTILKYLDTAQLTEDPAEITKNYETLREINLILTNLNMRQSTNLTTQINEKEIDSHLTNFLSLLTENMNSIEKLNLTTNKALQQSKHLVDPHYNQLQAESGNISRNFGKAARQNSDPRSN